MSLSHQVYFGVCLTVVLQEGQNPYTHEDDKLVPFSSLPPHNGEVVCFFIPNQNTERYGIFHDLPQSGPTFHILPPTGEAQFRWMANFEEDLTVAAKALRDHFDAPCKLAVAFLTNTR
jgi:hypothetical protein